MTFISLHRRRKWLLLAAAAAAGISSYASYRIYNSKQLTRTLNTLILISSSISSSAETLTLISSDLNRFLRSDSDQLPNSLTQLSKLTISSEASASISKISEALTAGIVRGFGSGSGPEPEPGFSDKLLDRMFSSSGSGFASAVAGSFAKNLVVAMMMCSNGSNEPWWVCLVSEERRAFVLDCVRSFVSTAVDVYLEKTMDVNTYDEFFAGVTNPRHERRVKEFAVSICNGAVETLVKTSHQVLTAPNEKIKEPSNRRLVLDVTGRVTFETVKSFLEFVVRKVRDGAGVVREEAVERGLEVMRYVSAKSMLIATLCFVLCMHVMVRMKGLMPA